MCDDFSCAILLICGVENSLGPGVEVEKILQFFCTACDRNHKSGTQCNTCGRWFHKSRSILKLKWRGPGKGTVISLDRIQAARGETVECFNSN